MRQTKVLVLVVLLVGLTAACGSLTSSSGGDDGDCSDDTECASHCSFTGTWDTGASGSTTNGGFCAGGSCYCCYAQFDRNPSTGAESNGYCLACNDVGSNCSADSNYECYAAENVCLYDY